MADTAIILTIITPVYRGIKYLPSCIRCVASQVNDQIEHLIIDGGSDDGTTEYLEKVAKKYSHIRWISEKDKGQSDAMNKGVRMARGPYIGFLNVDDVYSSDLLPRILKYIQSVQEKGPCFLLGKCEWLLENGEIKCISYHNNFTLTNCLKGVFPLNPVSYFYHKSFHEKYGYYDTEDRNAMDLGFLIRIVDKVNIVIFDEMWGSYCYRDESVTGLAINENQIHEMIATTVGKYLDSLSIFGKSKCACLLFIDRHEMIKKTVFYIKYPRAFFGALMELLKGKSQNE